MYQEILALIFHTNYMATLFSVQGNSSLKLRPYRRDNDDDEAWILCELVFTNISKVELFNCGSFLQLSELYFFAKLLNSISDSPENIIFFSPLEPNFRFCISKLNGDEFSIKANYFDQVINENSLQKNYYPHEIQFVTNKILLYRFTEELSADIATIQSSNSFI